jgi:hypothetical protein
MRACVCVLHLGIFGFSCFVCLFCEIWPLSLKNECRLRVFENRVLSGIFGPKRDEVTGRWRKLHNMKLYVLYCSPNINRVIKSRRLRWAGHVARMGEERCIQGFSGET